MPTWTRWSAEIWKRRKAVLLNDSIRDNLHSPSFRNVKYITLEPAYACFFYYFSCFAGVNSAEVAECDWFKNEKTYREKSPVKTMYGKMQIRAWRPWRAGRNWRGWRIASDSSKVLWKSKTVRKGWGWMSFGFQFSFWHCFRTVCFCSHLFGLVSLVSFFSLRPFFLIVEKHKIYAYQNKRNAQPLPHIERHLVFECFLVLFQELDEETENEDIGSGKARRKSPGAVSCCNFYTGKSW